MTGPRAPLEAVAAWRRETSLPYQAAFVAGLLLMVASFVAGFVGSHPYFGLPPIGGDATVLGRVLLERGDYLPALEEFRLAGLIDPENYDVEPELASASPEPGTEELIRQRRDRVQRRPRDATAHFLLGRSLLSNGQVVEAIESLENAQSLNPQLRGLHGILGRALLQAGDPEAATHAYRVAIAAEPRNPDWLEGLGLALYWTGQRAEAAEHFGAARTLRDRAETAAP